MKSQLLALLLAANFAMAEEPISPAVTAINSFGIDLLRKTSQPANNFLISPYSIQSALAMTYAGADGVTRDEMAKVLHFPKDDTALHHSFAQLKKTFDDAAARSSKYAEAMKKYGANTTPLTLAVANRLFGQEGYDFRPAYLNLVKDNYGAPFALMDFKKNSSGATKEINAWIEEATHQRIQNLIPGGALNDLTRLVLVNAIYFKGAWADEFQKIATIPRPFRVKGGKVENVATMSKESEMGYSKFAGFTAVTLSYHDGGFQFVILLPDSANGLAALEAKLTAAILMKCAKLESREVLLHLPKFKMEPPTLPLSSQLQAMGMKSAFDMPLGSANFDRMAPRRPQDYLSISDVFHKTFIEVDEKGTEAAAATSVFVVASEGIEPEPAKPIEVKVDHPFLFAIQHRPSGVCLFLGHVSDPR